MEQPEVQDSEVIEAQAPESTEAPQNEDDQLAGLLEDEQQSDDEIEDELDGVKVRGKKELVAKIKAERLMQADYTRKTQEVAEQRKAMEAQREQVAQQMKMAQEFAEEIGAVKAIDMRLAQLGQVNWDQLEQTDPVQAMSLQRQMRDLQAARAQVANQITTKQQQRALTEQQEIAKQVQEAAAVLQREIKGWGPEKEQQVTDFTLSLGFTHQQIRGITDPRLVKVLHDAMVLNQLRSKAQAKPKPEAQPAPVTRVTGGKASAASSGPSDRQSVDEWLKARNEQIKRK